MLVQLLVAVALADDPAAAPAAAPPPVPAEAPPPAAPPPAEGVPPVEAAAPAEAPAVEAAAPPAPPLPADVKAVVTAHQAETLTCVQQYHGAGDIALTFNIAATRVSDVSVASNTTGSDPQGACVADVVSHWRFKKVDDQPVTVVFKQYETK